MDNKLNFIDLFCGAGGLSTGLELAGHQCLLGIDNKENEINTFKLNHEKAKAICKDIEDITIDDLRDIEGNIDMVVGGPPCQGFSTIGKGDPKDSRNTLFFNFIDFIDRFNPKVVIFENVNGILAKKNEETVKEVKNLFKARDYCLEIWKMNAADYGVPQNRNRVIFIATKGIKIERPKVMNMRETVGFVLREVRRNKLLFKDNSHSIPDSRPSKKIDETRISYIPEGQSVRYEKDEIKYLPEGLRLSVDWKSLSEGRFRQAKYQRLDSKKPSQTILTSKQTYWHPTANRHLTAREAAAIQSFPLTFKFTGSTTSMWNQIGNAVPPLLAKAIGMEILRANLMKGNDNAVS